MRILMIGDVIGKPGRRAIQSIVPALRQEHGIDLVIANGENTAGALGSPWTPLTNCWTMGWMS